MASSVVVVESPAKAKTIGKYLGPDYRVLASYGHVRDLPAKDGSVRPEEDFAMDWEVDRGARARLADIANALKQADRLLLATDPDREGEAISWHVLEALRNRRVLKGQNVERVVFNAITRRAVLEAIDNPRPIDTALVEAYMARRALDYLVGFTLSPVLWRKLPGARSAGRVQSVALRLVCEREHAIEIFRPQEYWQIAAELTTPRNDVFFARVVSFEGTALKRHDIANETQAMTIKRMLEGAELTVAAVESKPTKRNPQPPFTTSTLQQEASRKLGYSAKRTMQVAQRLYEAGNITYMRTDGVDIAPEALNQARDVIAAQYGAPYLPDKPRRYKAKAKNAQEAHEAIRPTDMTFSIPKARQSLGDEQAGLYALIWQRTIASQMQSATIERTIVQIAANNDGSQAQLRANGSVIRFDGFLKLYQEGKDDEGDTKDGRLPLIQEREPLKRGPISATQHFTEPPPRYTEASLVKKMEELGIGRPSTYASTLSILRDRDYVRLDKKRLVPEDKGRLVTAFLENFFARYVEYGFTADLEEQLDNVSAGDLDWKGVLRDFWFDFQASVDETKDLRITQVLDALNETLGQHVFPAREDGADARKCDNCADGRLSLKVGRYGAFIGCSNYPDCRYTRQLAVADGKASTGPRILGRDEGGAEISVRTGRFGPYVQRLLDGEKKNAGLPRGEDPETITLERAIALLSLPREVGLHPETGKMITAGIGRYGPFVLHDGTYANLDSVEEVFVVGLNRAVSVIAEKKANGGGRRGAGTIKELGEHPDLGGEITVKSGRYGPYVHHGRINVTIPRDSDPETITLAQAVDLIAAKAAKGAKGKGRKGTKKTAKKTVKKAAKKKTAKKTPVKKKAIKKKAAKASVDASSA